LVHDQPGIASDVKPSDLELGGNVQTIDKCLVLSHIVRDRKMNVNHVPHAHVEGETKRSPTLAPLFISNPSKYMVQYSCSTGAGGNWVSVHSAMKSASIWDLMAV
jgi:hypothetical protein